MMQFETPEQSGLTTSLTLQVSSFYAKHATHVDVAKK